MPLDDLLRSLVARPELSTEASKFVYSSSHIIGVGLKGSAPDRLEDEVLDLFP